MTITAERIIAATASHFDCTIEELLSRDRHQPLALQRQIAMYLCRQLTELSFPSLGRVFGRDHTTVVHADRQIRADKTLYVGSSIGQIMKKLLTEAA